MSLISSFNPYNTQVNPSQFSPDGIQQGVKGPKIGSGNGFGDGFNMNVNGLKASVSEPIGKTGAAGGLADILMAVSEKQKEADSMKAAVFSGESTNLHQTMIVSQEANVAFTLLLEMRNKVMETYQELMRMQI